MSIYNAKKESGTPTPPAADRSILYPKNGGWCFMDSSGAEIAISANIGEISDYSSSSAPTGWAVCEGQLLLVADYAELFAVIGNVYGGDGVTNFKLPAKRLVGSGIRSIIFTGRHPQVVQQVTVPAAIHGPIPGYYKVAEALSFSAQLLDGIAVTGGPVKLDIDIGSTAHSLALVSSTATEWVFADYTVQSGDNGDVTATINLNGATLSSGGIDAVLSASSMVNVTVDTVAPTSTFSALALSVDTGSSSTDFITKTAEQTITATLSGALSATERAYGSLDNGATWTDITDSVFNTSLSWAVTLTASNTLKLKVVDLAGNEGTVTSQAYTLDTTAPAAPTVNALTTSNTTPTITGTATVGASEVLTVVVNSVAYTAGGADLTLSGTDWTLVIPSGDALAIGTYPVTAAVTDAAGNTTSDSTTDELVITA